ncbi:MAG: type I-C CRISPR-associated protein Cas8c/Csd1 [Endomicrobium sp.]|uniref:type I-C CRISPR-associated protein Cas8c/Csd1 n=1 Tax=Candidatus Endomicrobiellum pyrsonymphae TaxID=1408203 RepID=UPI00357868E3|nr:type I-C CRISPR-associated protein Cas8c/Csd1 [Endomicrobium sp.]
MSWFQRLYETYENCVTASESGEYEIAPIGHTHKDCNIEITLNEKAEMVDAQIIYKKDTIIPTTDEINNCLYPLAVKIENFKKDSYRQKLKEWIDFNKSFNKSNEKLNIISNYVQRDTLIPDLEKRGILWLSGDGKFIEKPKNKKDITDKYKIFQNVKKQEDAFIRWIVETDKNHETWEDKSIIESWIEFRKAKLKNGTCYITGDNTICANDHPQVNGKAKLISSNDDKNFIFNGRFVKQNEALNIGFEVSQKAHNTLKWLVATERKQAYHNVYHNHSQRIVAFTINAKYGNIGKVFGKDFVKSIKGYSIDFKRLQNENIVLLEMDNASLDTGRAGITYYKELLGSQYLENIKNWHKKYYWQHFLKIKNKDNQREEYQYFYGPPSIATIADVYFYKKDKYLVEKNEQKIKKKLIRDLMPSVLEDKNIPKYIEKHFVEKASNPVALNDYQWKTILGIACSIYKGNNLYDKNKKEGDYLMLKEENDTRDYLYGRLLAIVDYAEEKSLLEQQKSKKTNLKNDEGDEGGDDDKDNGIYNYPALLYKLVKDEGGDDDKDNSIRITNAKRYMRQFTLKPYSTWQFLWLRYNEAYMPRLKKNNPGLERVIDTLRIEIENKFISEEDYKNDNKLAGVYQLAYSCQMCELRKCNKGNIQNSKKNDKASKGE